MRGGLLLRRRRAGRGPRGRAKKALAVGATKAVVATARRVRARLRVARVARRRGSTRASTCSARRSRGRDRQGPHGGRRAEGADAIATARPARATIRCASSSPRTTSGRASRSSRRGASGSSRGAPSSSRTRSEHAIPIEATADKPYSVDRNLLHTSYEGGVLEDPWRAPDPAMFQRTRDPPRRPTTPRVIEIDYEKGDADRD